MSRNISLAALIVAGGVFSQDTLASTADQTPPPAISRRVGNEFANFSYISDADKEGSLFQIYHSICNHGNDGLAFKWDKPNLSRSLFSPLAPGKCEENSFPVTSLAQDPDTHSKILYTQQKLEQVAATYVAADNASEQQKAENGLLSYFKTSLHEASGAVREVLIKVLTRYADNSLTIKIEAPAGIEVGLGNLEKLVLSGDRIAQINNQMELAKKNNIEIDYGPVPKMFQNIDFDFLPSNANEDFAILFLNRKSSFEFNLTLPIRENERSRLRQRSATLFVSNGERNIIGTAVYRSWFIN